MRALSPSDPPGTLVQVLDDHSRLTLAWTRSKIWKLGHGEQVVLLSDRTGGYLASRCKVFEDDEEPAAVTEPQPSDDRIRKLTQEVLDAVWEFLQSEGECPNATPVCGAQSYCASQACGICGMARAMELLNVAKFEAKQSKGKPDG